jgi:hypothetical protein
MIAAKKNLDSFLAFSVTGLAMIMEKKQKA